MVLLYKQQQRHKVDTCFCIINSSTSTMATREEMEQAAKQCTEQLEHLQILREESSPEGIDSNQIIAWGWIAQSKLEQNAIEIDRMIEEFDINPATFVERLPEVPVEFIRLKTLYKHKDEMQTDISRYFYDMVKNGNIDVVDLLLYDERVEPAEYNNRAFRAAAHKGHLNIVVRLLQDHRIDPSDKENMALGDAITFGHREIEEILLQDARVQRQAVINQANLGRRPIGGPLNDLYFHLPRGAMGGYDTKENTMGPVRIRIEEQIAKHNVPWYKRIVRLFKS